MVWDRFSRNEKESINTNPVYKVNNLVLNKSLAEINDIVNSIRLDKDNLDVINRLADNFKVNNLMLPSASITSNSKFITSIPFYIFIITWIYALVSIYY